MASPAPPRRGTVATLLGIMTPQERRRFYRVYVVVILLAAFETIGIGAIVPFMSMLVNPDIIHTSHTLEAVYDGLGFHDPHTFLLFSGSCLLAIFLFKNFFSMFATWLQLRFTWDGHHAFAMRMLWKYLSKPYAYFLTHNTTELSKNVLSEVGSLVAGIVVPLMTLMTQLTVAAFIVGLLFWMDPFLAVSIIVVLGGAYAGVYVVSKRRLSRLGEERMVANALRFKTVGEAFGGLKELKVYGREGHFLRTFEGPSKMYADNTVSSMLISQLPRFAIESLAFGGIVAILLYVLAVKNDVSQVIPTVSLYAMAGYRLMPCLQQSMMSMANLKFYAPALERMQEDLTYADLPAPPPEPVETGAGRMPFGREIRLVDVTYRYPNTDTPVIDGLNLVIPKNTSVGFVGTSGAGKTTVVDLILGLLAVESGTIEVDGVPVTDANMAAWQRNIGYIPQEIFLGDDTVARNIAFGIPDDRIDRAAVERAAHAAHLQEFVLNELPQGFDTEIGERGVRLSGGQRQRIGIARALYHDPPVLIMDEATSSLDGVSEAVISQSIHDLSGSKTILIIAHRLTTVRHCDVIYFLERGKVTGNGTYDELFASNRTFRSMAGGGT